MEHEYLLEFLEKKDIPIVHKARHAYLTYYGFEQQSTYVLKEGVVKTSIILRDGREFNISYLKAPNIISLLKDEVSQYTSAPFNVRVESESAVFYKIPRVTFWEYVNKDKKLQDYITEHFYTCSAKILQGLGRMYAGGGELTENIDAAGGTGTSEFASKAIDIFAMNS